MVHSGSFVCLWKTTRPVHTAKKVSKFLNEAEIECDDWPAKSPGLYPIEKVSEKLARVVYQGGKQYNTVSELQAANIQAWDTISLQYIQEFIKWISKRFHTVLDAQEVYFKYWRRAGESSATLSCCSFFVSALRNQTEICSSRWKVILWFNLVRLGNHF